MVASRLKFIEREYQAGTKLEVILLQSARMDHEQKGYSWVTDKEEAIPGEKLVGYLAWIDQERQQLYLTASHQFAVAHNDDHLFPSSFPTFYIKEDCIYDIKVIIDTLPGSP